MASGQPPLPPGPTPLATIIAEAIAQAHRLADILNANAVSGYSLAKKNVVQRQETAPPGVVYMPPSPPTLILVNEQAITDGETNDTDYSATEFIYYQYVDPNPIPVLAPPPDIVINLSEQLGPGIYRADANTHTLPAGTKHTQDGHVYVLQFNPLIGPLWQQIS